MKNHIDDYLSHLKTIGFAHTTLESYERFFRPFIHWLKTQAIGEPNQITPDIIQDYQQYLYHDYRKDRPLTLGYQVNLLKILKPFCLWMIRKGHLLTDPTIDLKMPKLPKRLPRDILTQREIRKIFSLPDLKTPSGYRDRFVLELLYTTGIRRAELLNLTLNDINTERRELFIHQGKGAKDRVVPIPRKTADMAWKYISDIRPQLLKKETDRLIISDRGKPFAYGSITHVVTKSMREAKLKKRITMHSFRHTCATHLLNNKADIRVIQELLGHESLNTTQRYTRVDITDLKRMIDNHHPRQHMES